MPTIHSIFGPRDRFGNPLSILKNVTAAILAGGLGTRLKSVVGERPKVLAPVRDRPYLTYLLDRLADAGIRETVLLTGYRADQVRRAVGEKYRGMKLVHSREPSPLGTGGALRHALPRLVAPTVLLLNGDSWCDVDLRELGSFHFRAGADLTMVLVEEKDTTRYGRVRIGRDGAVLGFEEKTSSGPGRINAGVYFIRRDLIDAIPSARPLSLEHDLIPLWLKQGRRLLGYRQAGSFLDIGTPASYAQAENWFAERNRRGESL